LVTTDPDARGRTEALRRRIPLRALRFSFVRSGGPGGQNVNKVSTRVMLCFDLTASESLSDAEKRRIRARLRGRITKDDRLKVTCSRHRTQAANRRDAIGRFYELLAEALQPRKPRQATAVPAQSRQVRLRDKQARSQRKRQRQRPPAGDEA